MEPVTHFDFIVIGYHREAVEVLHPWITDLDDKCIWASELYQTMEASLVYRNHMLAFKGLIIWNGKHRHRPARACGEVLEKVMQDMAANAPGFLRHCSISNAAEYVQGAISGEVRTKRGSYHLMHTHFSSYLSVNQSLFSCANTVSWNRSDAHCCSLDSWQGHHSKTPQGLHADSLTHS